MKVVIRAKRIKAFKDNYKLTISEAKIIAAVEQFCNLYGLNLAHAFLEHVHMLAPALGLVMDLGLDVAHVHDDSKVRCGAESRKKPVSMSDRKVVIETTDTRKEKPNEAVKGKSSAKKMNKMVGKTVPQEKKALPQQQKKNNLLTKKQQLENQQQQPSSSFFDGNESNNSALSTTSRDSQSLDSDSDSDSSSFETSSESEQDSDDNGSVQRVQAMIQKALDNQKKNQQKKSAVQVQEKNRSSAVQVKKRSGAVQSPVLLSPQSSSQTSSPEGRVQLKCGSLGHLVDQLQLDTESDKPSKQQQNLFGRHFPGSGTTVMGVQPTPTGSTLQPFTPINSRHLFKNYASNMHEAMVHGIDYLMEAMSGVDEQRKLERANELQKDSMAKLDLSLKTIILV